MNDRVTWHKSLTTRVLFFLTLALVPLGVIGLLQNQRLSNEIESRSELSLMALTERAASGERQLIQRAFGAVEALSGLSFEVLDDREMCREIMRRFIAANDNFAFAGFIGTDGKVECSSVDNILDYSQHPRFPDLLKNPRPDVQVNLNAEGSGQSVMVISQPHYDGDVFDGYFSVSLPLRVVGNTDDFSGDADPVTLVTFNTQGQLLSSESNRQRAEASLPRDIALANLASGESRTLIAKSEDGQEMVYSIVPIVPDLIYALGSWNLDRLEGTGRLSAVLDAALPITMWLASLLVVWLVMDRLVIDRVKKLNIAMRRFSRTRTLPDLPNELHASTELDELERSLYGMAQDILHDEAAQEDQLREKSVLLKEVHHRVKNNLQIISSIMNMQIRKAQAEETKCALGQVQDRIMGLSGVHRTLYQAESLSQVNAASLIEQIVEQSRVIGSNCEAEVDVELKLDPVIIFPDQAVPLSMLVSEALTNAMKYIGGQSPRLSVTLSLTGDSEACLEVENSRAANQTIDDDLEFATPGLGQQLIRAFTSQLGGKADVVQTDETYRLVVAFQVEHFKEDPQDY